jgi:ABC-type polysaccharide/polyol phosphate transport system ATPase subunit
VIKIENLTKGFTSYLKKTKAGNKRLVLDGISLNINKGERVAVIGRNGAGKTTLLRLISGSLLQSSGSIEVNGDIYPLMSLGLGINEKFTGRENIYSSLVYNGFVLSKDALKSIEYDIEDFTELGEFLDRPFYTYSLGMKMRLMFAIASAAKPAIFLIDEILGAGDAYFLMKSQERLRKVIEQNQSTLLLVSHSTQLLRKFCDRGIWIKDGKVFLEGNINDVCVAYDAYIERISEGYLNKDIKSKEELMYSLENGKRVYTWQEKSEIIVSSFDIEQEDHALKLSFSLIAKTPDEYSLRILITLWGRKGDRIGRIENDMNSINFKKSPHHKVDVYLQRSLLPLGIFDITISIFQHLKDSSLGELKNIYVGSNMASIPSQNNHSVNVNVIPHKWL